MLKAACRAQPRTSNSPAVERLGVVIVHKEHPFGMANGSHPVGLHKTGLRSVEAQGSMHHGAAAPDVLAHLLTLIRIRRRRRIRIRIRAHRRARVLICIHTRIHVLTRILMIARILIFS